MNRARKESGVEIGYVGIMSGLCHGHSEIDEEGSANLQ